MSASASNPAAGSPEQGELHSHLFGMMVSQQANMALMFMGKMEAPGGDKVPKDLDTARIFISNLEMLQAKTRGNLEPGEEGFLKQMLMNVRMAYVEAVDQQSKGTSAQPAAAGQPTASAAPGPETSPASAEAPAQPQSDSQPTPGPGTPEPEHRPKFSKKY